MCQEKNSGMKAATGPMDTTLTLHFFSQSSSACLVLTGYSHSCLLKLSLNTATGSSIRFYLGYPAIGLLKFSTLGFFFIGHLVCLPLPNDH